MSILRNGVILASVTAIAVAIPLLINEVLKARISQEQNKVLFSTVNLILKSDSYNNDLLASCRVPNQLYGHVKQIYRAEKNGELVAYIIVSIAKGYQSDISIMTIVDSKGVILGLKILNHAETPGIGDLIVTDKHWAEQFIGKKITDARQRQWAVTSDGGTFDKFTGATITPRAVVNEIKFSLLETAARAIQDSKNFESWAACHKN